MLHHYILDCIFHYIPHKLNFSINRLHINKALSRGKNNKLYVKSKTGVARTFKMDDKTMAI